MYIYIYIYIYIHIYIIYVDIYTYTYISFIGRSCSYADHKNHVDNSLACPLKFKIFLNLPHISCIPRALPGFVYLSIKVSTKKAFAQD